MFTGRANLSDVRAYEGEEPPGSDNTHRGDLLEIAAKAKVGARTERAAKRAKKKD